MQRILIIGCPGSGKTTFSRTLAEKLRLTIIHLDEHYWNEGWTETPQPEWTTKVLALCEGDKWIIDGNYINTLELRLKYADAVIFLDRTRWLCLWRIIKRILFNWGKTRKELPPNCPENFDLEFFKFIYHFPIKQRKRITNLLASFNGGKIYLIRTNKESRSFLNNF